MHQGLGTRCCQDHPCPDPRPRCPAGLCIAAPPPPAAGFVLCESLTRRPQPDAVWASVLRTAACGPGRSALAAARIKLVRKGVPVRLPPAGATRHLAGFSEQSPVLGSSACLDGYGMLGPWIARNSTRQAGCVRTGSAEHPAAQVVRRSRRAVRAVRIEAVAVRSSATLAVVVPSVCLALRVVLLGLPDLRGGPAGSNFPWCDVSRSYNY